ncbi:MAG: thiol-disulfide oxidoreductase DCC family protein [Halopseudomonas sp.]|uniref:thiol-disulfide oxidoreductase DCC family protein n=1 Tax=Halopseudomonas sp. TaxID=2901191 RepID=UPI0030011F0D
MTPTLLSADSRIILFDGVCRLCNGWANFIIQHDHSHRYLLCNVQSVAGQQLLQHFGYPTDRFATMLVIEQGRCFEKSEAFFRVMRGLGWPWRWVTALRLVPRPLRDWLYDRVALNRYRLFGQYEVCRLPAPEHAERFVDGR